LKRPYTQASRLKQDQTKAITASSLVSNQQKKLKNNSKDLTKAILDAWHRNCY
jgi:hypothetical protein